MIGAIIGGTIGAVVYGAIMIVVFRGIARRSPAGVTKRLPAPGAEHTVRLTRMTAISGTWNPAKKPGIGNPLCTPGTGTYRLTDGGQVELVWEASGGSTHTYRGPIPDSIRPDSPQRRRVRHVLRAMGAVYAFVTVAGFAVGFLASSGTTGARLGFGLLGVAVGWVLVWLVVLVMNVARGTKRALGRPARND